MSAREPVIQERYVLPGESQASATPLRLLTILGSCVSVCLFDPVRGVGGLNHFLLPGLPPAKEQEPLRWGAAAIASLFEQVLELGANEHFLEAKLFGGAQIGPRPASASFCIGDRNIEFAREELARRRVVIRNQSVGGGRGRKIVLETHTGVVWLKELAGTGHS